MSCYQQEHPILEVSTRAIPSDGSIDGGAGLQITLSKCPEALRPLMIELGNIGKQAKKIRTEDTEAAIEVVQRGDEPTVPRLEQLRRMLQEGVSCDRGSSADDGEQHCRRVSVEGRMVEFSKRSLH